MEDEDDELEVDLEPEGHLVVDLFAAPALFRQRVAHDGRLFDPRVEMERYVGPRLHAAAAGEVHLEPVRQRTEREDPALRICTPTLTFFFFFKYPIDDEDRHPHLSAPDGTEPLIRTISPGKNPPRIVPAKGIDCGQNTTNMRRVR